MRFFFQFALILCATLGLRMNACADEAPRPGATGDGGHLWLVAPAAKAADGWQILHRDPTQGDEMSPLPRGMAQPVALPDGAPAICARGGVFYAATRLPEGSMQLAQWRVGQPSPEGMRLTQRVVGDLPRSARLLALAADRKTLWLAVAGVPAEVVKPMVDAAAGTSSADSLAIALRMPPGLLPSPKPLPRDDKPAPALPAEERLILLRADGGGGCVLVATLPPVDHAWLASDGEQLVLAEGPHALWRVTAKGLEPCGDPGPFTHLAFAGRTLVLAQILAKHTLEGAAWRDILGARWSAWNPRATPALSPAGDCALPLEPGDGWGVVEWAGHPALARVAASFKPSQPAAFLAPVDLHGARLQEVVLRQARDAAEARWGVLLLQVAVTALAVFLMVWSWRKGPRLFPKLPRGLARPGLLRRAAAGAVDLTVAVVPVAWMSGVPVGALLREWPLVGEPTSLEDMRLGFLAGGIFIAHTTLGEALAGRSLGKALVGLRVVGLDGGRAAPWRVLLRGLLKWLELLSPALLVLMVFSPFGQRLGDLAAGTAVAAETPEE